MTKNTDETSKDNLIVGEIPESVINAARSHANLAPNEVWGVYLTPDDPRNPHPGEHYLGQSNKTVEQMQKIITKETTALNTKDELQNLWAIELENLKSLSPKDFAELIENGSQIIGQHERKHKKQWEETNYQSIIIQASGYIRQLETSSQHATETQIKPIRTEYQDLVLIAEVQALAEQTAVDIPYGKAFNMYWYSKTFELFNISVEDKMLPGQIRFDPSKENPLDIEYILKPVDILETLYYNLNTGSEFDSKISNVYGLLSRALYLCDDPAEALKNIRSGELTYGEFKSLIRAGLERMRVDSAQELIERSKILDANLNEVLAQKATKLSSLISV